MGIIDNPVFREISAIFNDGAKPIKYKWTCEIKAGDEVFTAFNIMVIDIKRDYLAECGDDRQIVFSMGQGDFDHHVFPNRENIIVTLFREPLGENSGLNESADGVQTEMFRGQLYDSKSEHMQAAVPGQTDKDTSNIREMKTVVMQLIDMPMEQLRLMTVGGIYRKANTASVIRLLLGGTSKKAAVPDEYTVKGVDVAEGFDDKVWNHVIIPHGLKLTGLAKYVHEKAGGVYNTGIGCYLQNGIWYVFPPYNIKRYDTAKDKITILNVPSRLLPGVERSYRIKDDQLYIIVTGDVKHNDLSDISQLTLGNGVRYTNADNVVEGFTDVQSNKAVADRSKNNVEAQLTQRKNGMDNILFSEERATSNHAYQYSKLAARNGSYVQFVWENANPSLIKPGQAARFIFPVGSILKEVYGVVQNAEYLTESKGQTQVNNNYVCTAAITLFVEREEKEV